MYDSSIWTTKTITSWQAYPKALTDFCGDGDWREKYLFRGQRDSTWSLQASFDRSVVGTLVQREEAAEASVRGFELALLAEGMPKASNEEIVGLAQHYGLPTRALDWTFSPYVAMFFACAGALENQLRSRPTVYILDTTKLAKTASTNEISIIRYLPSQNVRLRNQKGCFTYLKGDFGTLEEFFAHKKQREIINRLVISKSAIRESLIHLISMDIGYHRLFPGLEGAARQAWLDHLLRS